MGILKLDNPTALRRIDLNHEDWDDPTPGQDDVRRELDMEVLDTPDHPVEDAAMTGSHSKRRRTPTTAGSLGTWQLIRDDQQLPPPLGPLRVVSSSKKSRATNQYTVHLLTQEGKAVGCGWEPPSTKALDLSPEDFSHELDSYAQCNRCFKRCSYPKEWHAEVIQTQGALSEGFV